MVRHARLRTCYVAERLGEANVWDDGLLSWRTDIRGAAQDAQLSDSKGHCIPLRIDKREAGERIDL